MFLNLIFRCNLINILEEKSDSGSEFFRSCFPESSLRFTTKTENDAISENLFDSDTEIEPETFINKSDLESEKECTPLEVIMPQPRRMIHGARSECDLRDLEEISTDRLTRHKSERDFKDIYLPNDDDLIYAMKDIFCEDKNFRRTLSLVSIIEVFSIKIIAFNCDY
jgi:hypothetical protein